MDTAPKGGHSLLAAFQHLLNDSFGLRAAEITMRAKSAQGPSEATEVVRLRGILWAVLAERLQTSTLVATGFIHGATVPQRIHSAFFNNAVPDYDRDEVSMNGATYGGVRIFLVDAAPPTQELVSTDTRSEPELTAPPSTPVSARKGVGGAPPAYPWDEFVVEVIRFANEIGLTTRAELTRHMRDWVEQSWATQPEADTIRRKVRELCPPEIPLN